MLYVLIITFFLLLLVGPTLWVKYVMWRHSTEIADMPGTGGELANHLIETLKLDGVKVKAGQKGQNSYNPEEKIVSLSPELYHGKSLTAVAIAAHEVGHAIQFTRNEPISQLRRKYLKGAFAIKRLGAAILLIAPIIFAVVKVPNMLLVNVAIGIATMLASAAMYVAILPEEYDASFNKALPILESGYLPEKHIPAVKKILRAAALTYLAGALADSIRLWLLLRFLR